MLQKGYDGKIQLKLLTFAQTQLFEEVISEFEGGKLEGICIFSKLTNIISSTDVD